ncbi:alpha amylase catalytic region [Candidatus Moduliflexus flocculans]|uniref:Alpha amylase catalytic region n=1 Tax=Candidatus Moduliflexus flocculans TaxID=1499966 RepID=A0A0S6VZG9_9BACT|nr:alpha amylase catalytic region [Candidatus Moduliflexus flocculans]
MTHAHYRSLYQINTRVWLTELSRQLGRAATLDDIPDAELDRLAGLGMDWVWLLSVWQTGLAGQQVSRSQPEWRADFQKTLPDLREEDIAGSGFAITAYTVSPALGGEAALTRLRQRLAKRGLKLMLDFVPNHTGLDHPWVEDHPEYFIMGTEDLLAHEPQNYIRVTRKKRDMIFAYGRDPYFSGWPDTLQLDYSNPATQEAMIRELKHIASLSDGARCDMAMLMLPEIFERTWGRKPAPFWPHAIQRVREQTPNFCFMAEVYWDMEWTLQQQGFDYAYDKRLYDRLREGHARPVREHLRADLAYQTKLARFLENHDEPRAAATFDLAIHQAAAVITYFIPGLRFFHQGQFDGRKIRISPHLVRAPEETPNKELQAFYDQLLAILRKPVVKNGEWQWLDCQPAWDGNNSWEAFIAHSWRGSSGEHVLVVVNYAPHQSQCYLKLPFPDIQHRSVRFKDLLSSASYLREGKELVERGLYLDLPSWSYHVFDVSDEP